MSWGVHVSGIPVLMQALAPGSDTKLDIDTLEAVAGSAPTVELPAGQVLGQTLADIMVAIKLQESKSAGRRLIKVHHPLGTMHSNAFSMQTIETAKLTLLPAWRSHCLAFCPVTKKTKRHSYSIHIRHSRVLLYVSLRRADGAHAGRWGASQQPEGV